METGSALNMRRTSWHRAGQDHMGTISRATKGMRIWPNLSDLRGDLPEARQVI